MREFEKGGMSLTQIQAKYGIKGHSTVYKWRQNLQNSKKMCTFAAEIKPQVADEVPMKKRSAEELEEEATAEKISVVRREGNFQVGAPITPRPLKGRNA